MQKAQLVAHEFFQQEGVKFDNAFARIAQMEAIRVLVLATKEG